MLGLLARGLELRLEPLIGLTPQAGHFGLERLGGRALRGFASLDDGFPVSLSASRCACSCTARAAAASMRSRSTSAWICASASARARATSLASASAAVSCAARRAFSETFFS